MTRGIMAALVFCLVAYMATALFAGEFISPVILLAWQPCVYLAVALHVCTALSLPYWKIASAKLRWLVGGATDDDYALLAATCRHLWSSLLPITAIGVLAVMIATLATLENPEPAVVGERLASAVLLPLYASLLGIVLRVTLVELERRLSE